MKKGDILKLSEIDFQNIVLIPLFRKMGFRDVTPFDGTSLERGKDIVMWKEDDFRQRRNYGVVVKARKITGNAEASNGAMNVVNQVRQMLKTTYLNPVNGEKEQIHQCIVACSKSISKTAMFSIEGELENNLSKLVTWINPETNLFALIDEHLPQNSIFEQLANIQQKLDQTTEKMPYRIVADTSNRLSFHVKDAKSYMEKPLTFKGRLEFDTETHKGRKALKAFQDHQERGVPVEIDGDFIKEFDLGDCVPDWLKPGIGKDSKLKFAQNPIPITMPIRVEVHTSDGEQEVLDQIDLQFIRGGTNEILLSNETQKVPWRFSLVSNNVNQTTRFSYDYNLNGFNVYQQFSAIKFMRALEKGGTFHIKNKVTGLDLPPQAIPEMKDKFVTKNLLTLVENLLIVQTKTDLTFSLPARDISSEEFDDVMVAMEILTNGTALSPVESVSIALEKSEAEKAFNSFKGGEITKVIYKSEKPEQMTIFDQVVELGTYLFVADCYLDEEEIRRLRNKTVWKGKAAIDLNFKLKEPAVTTYFTDFLSPEIRSEIEARTLTDIFQNEKKGVFLRMTDDVT